MVMDYKAIRILFLINPEKIIMLMSSLSKKK